MTREEIDRVVAVRLGLSQREVAQVTGLFLQVVQEALISGDSIELRTFGVIQPKVYPERKQHIPGKGMARRAELPILKYTPSRTLQGRVREAYIKRRQQDG